MSRYKVTLIKDEPGRKQRGVIVGTRRLFPGQSAFLQAAAYGHIAKYLHGLTIRGVVEVTEIPDTVAAVAESPISEAPAVVEAPVPEEPAAPVVASFPELVKSAEEPAAPAQEEAPAPEEAPPAEEPAETPAEAPAEADATAEKKPAPRRTTAPKFSA